MDSTRSNIFIRLKAFIDSLGIFTFFPVVLLLIFGIGALSGWFENEEDPEDAAAAIRYETKAEVEAAQVEFLKESRILMATERVAADLADSKAVAVEKPEQIVPGSDMAMKRAEEPGPDLAAIDEAGDEEEDAPIDPAQMEAGKAAYMVCAACHGQNGEGGPAAPPLAESEWVTGPISNLIVIQLRGLKGPIEVNGKVYEYPAGMAPMAYQSDDQIAAVLTYVRNSFGNKASAVKAEQVEALRGEVGKPQVTVEDLIKP